jgi:N-acetylmuramoyl-L-alanine amidase
MDGVPTLLKTIKMSTTHYNILIDMGHGGLDSSGNYTTAPGKMHTFPDGEVIYEGVINRQIGKRVYEHLEELGYCPVYVVHPDEAKDVSLQKRVDYINFFDPDNTIGVSFHSNASAEHNARGNEIWTSVGETESDILATYIGEEIINEFPELKFRTEFSDGDLDKESQFFILRKTLCPMVLIETLFFDNREDAELLKSPVFQKRVAWRISNGIVRYLKTVR